MPWQPAVVCLVTLVSMSRGLSEASIGHAISVHDGPAHVQRLADLLDSYKS